MRAVIIDDEILNIKSLEFDIRKFCPDIEIVETADNVPDAIEMILKIKPDVVFSDIQIHNQTVFDIIESIQNDTLIYILFTAYDQYTLPAIKHGVVDYLLKPVLVKDLLAAVNKAKTKYHYIRNHSAKNNAPERVRFISIQAKDQILLIKVEDIIHLESNGSYTHLYTVQQQKHTSSKPIKEFESTLPQDMFIRVHNSHIINLNYVSGYVRTRNGLILLKNDTKIPVSPLKKKEITRILGL